MPLYPPYLDAIASDIQPVGPAAAAGSAGKAADARHVHAGISPVASTGESGYALVNGTGTIISWTAPSDGNLHVFSIFARLIVATGLTGGAIYAGNGGTILTGGTVNSGAFLWAANQGAGDYFLTKTTLAGNGVLGPGEQIYIKQSTAVSAGAGTVFAEIWAL